MSTNDTICYSCAHTKHAVNGRYCNAIGRYVEYGHLTSCEKYKQITKTLKSKKQ